MDNDTKLILLNYIEDKGVGFFSRRSDNTIVINVRGKHGNDPDQWTNANKIAEAFGMREVKEWPYMDRISGNVVVIIKGWKSTCTDKAAV